MRVFVLTAAFAMAGLLAACDDDQVCTQESATAKATEVMTSMQALATSNPEKLAELTPLLTEIQTTMTAEGADLVAACKALDDIAAQITAAAVPADAAMEEAPAEEAPAEEAPAEAPAEEAPAEEVPAEPVQQ